MKLIGEFEIVFTKQAMNDIKYLKESNLDKKAKSILEIIRQDPFKKPPPFKKLIGDLDGLYSRRLNIQHRIVYSVNKKDKYIKIVRMWKHY